MRKTVNLTDTLIGRTRPVKGKQVELWDSALRGFGARVGNRGSSLFYRYNFGGRKRRLSWRWPENSVATGRSNVAIARQAIEKGDDPAALLDERRTGMTIKEFWTGHFTPRHGALKKSFDTDKHRYGKHVEPHLGGRPMASITAEDVEGLLLRMRDGGASDASVNRVRALLSTIFRKAAAWKKIPSGMANPVDSAPKFHEQSRERLLSHAEVAALGAALRDLKASAPPGRTAPFAVIHFLSLTGWRVGEACGLRWQDVDLDRSTAHLAKTKTGSRSTPLAAAAVQLLRQLPRDREQEHVFPSLKDPALPMDRSELRGPWEKLCKAAGIKNARLHDLRHLVASTAASSGAGLHAVGGLLGHTNAGTTARYAHHDPAGIRKLADTTATEVAGLLDGSVVDVAPGKYEEHDKKEVTAQ